MGGAAYPERGADGALTDSFIGISKAHTTNLAVAPDIAEALLATALGLVAAIPAVIVCGLGGRLHLGEPALRHGDRHRADHHDSQRADPKAGLSCVRLQTNSRVARLPDHRP